MTQKVLLLLMCSVRVDIDNALSCSGLGIELPQAPKYMLLLSEAHMRIKPALVELSPSLSQFASYYCSLLDNICTRT